MTQRVPSTQALSEEKFERTQSLLVIKEWQLYISQNMSKIQVDILSGLFICHIYIDMSQICKISNSLIDRKDNIRFCSDHHYYHQDHLCSGGYSAFAGASGLWISCRTAQPIARRPH